MPSQLSVSSLPGSTKSRALGLCVAVALSATLAATDASAQACNASQDQVTLNVRELQSHLMVAALSCGYQQQYNQFVTKFQGDLAKNGSALTSYFSRQYGGSAKSQLNSYVTRLANDASRVSMGNRRDFCQQASAAFQTLQSTPTGQLAAFTASTSPFNIGASGCSQTRTAQK